MDGEKYADRDLPVWQHLAPMDSRESVLVRDAHDGGFVTELRPDVRRMVVPALYVAWFVRCSRLVSAALVYSGGSTSIGQLALHGFSVSAASWTSTST
jgi:hypothetical protein